VSGARADPSEPCWNCSARAPSQHTSKHGDATSIRDEIKGRINAGFRASLFYKFMSTHLGLPESLHAHLPDGKIARNVSRVQQKQAQAGPGRARGILTSNRAFSMARGALWAALATKYFKRQRV
jgi:hypothetical protein